MCPGTCAAYRAAGAVVHGVDLVMRGEATAAFCAVRPPGHHAGGPGRGFCFPSTTSRWVRAHALAEHGLERVAICDFDAHHGDGIEEIFRDDPRVLYCSSFEHPAFTHAGADTESTRSTCRSRPAPTGARFGRAVADAWFDRMAALRSPDGPGLGRVRRARRGRHDAAGAGRRRLPLGELRDQARGGRERRGARRLGVGGRLFAVGPRAASPRTSTPCSGTSTGATVTQGTVAARLRGRPSGGTLDQAGARQRGNGF